MSRTSATTCDSCGRIQKVTTADIYNHKEGIEPFWSLSYSSTDFASKNGYEMISGGWDLCGNCMETARNALLKVLGDPAHDNWRRIEIPADMLDTGNLA